MGGSPGKGTGIGNSVPFREVNVMSSSTRFLKMMPDRYWRSSNPKKATLVFFSQDFLFFFKRQLAGVGKGNMPSVCHFCFGYCDATFPKTQHHPGLLPCSPVANRAKARPFLVEEKTLAKSPRKGWKKGFAVCEFVVISGSFTGFGVLYNLILV